MGAIPSARPMRLVRPSEAFGLGMLIIHIPNTSKDHERNVRYIKGGLLRKGGYLANVDGGPKRQYFPAFSQKFYFALIRINSQKFAHLKK